MNYPSYLLRINYNKIIKLQYSYLIYCQMNNESSKDFIISILNDKIPALIVKNNSHCTLSETIKYKNMYICPNHVMYVNLDENDIKYNPASHYININNTKYEFGLLSLLYINHQLDLPYDIKVYIYKHSNYKEVISNIYALTEYITMIRNKDIIISLDEHEFIRKLIKAEYKNKSDFLLNDWDKLLVELNL